jgi:hypothetical protein
MRLKYPKSMAKIKFKNGDFILLTNEEATRISKNKLESGASLAGFPVAVVHQDGVWVGADTEIQQIFLDNTKQDIVPFASKADLANFHMKYGKHTEKFIKGFGLLDSATKYRIDVGLVELSDNGFFTELVDLPRSKEFKDQALGYWATYQQNLTEDGTLLNKVTLDGINYFPKSELREALTGSSLRGGLN